MTNNAGGQRLPAPLRYFAVALVAGDCAKFRWGVAKIIFPTFLFGRGQ